MVWTECIKEAIDFIEENLTEDIKIEEVAERACISPFYFQKGFTMLCGYTVAEYIRNRRLTLAGQEVSATENKIIDIALKYGYDSPDAFTKSFTRFHKVTPTAVRKNEAMIKYFAPLKIKLTLEGGYSMDYKMVEKDEFTVIGLSKTFKYETAMEEIPKFWTEHYKTGGGEFVCGQYGVNIDERMGGTEFEYLIADNYNPIREFPEKFVTKVIPKFTWAVFGCKGPMPEAIQEVNKKIYSEWMPGLTDYEIAAGYCIEMYEDAKNYPKGTADENYYSELWLPVRRKG